MLVRIVKDWKYPESFFSQTPHGSKRWGDVEFTEDKVRTCDYLIVLQRPPYTIKVNCPKGNAWLITQEPPIDYFRFYTKAFKYFDRVFTYYEKTGHPRVQALHPVLPWHVLMSYDELASIQKANLGSKKDELVWITSNKNNLPGQKARMNFKDYLLAKGFDFKLYGAGFRPIVNKFDGLFPCKYALAIENYSVEHYWTEKLADSFLSWSLPFYWGASNLEDYFPSRSFIRIDVHKPEEALKIIQQSIENKEWEKRIDAIEESRNLILNKYQFFPYVAEMVQADAVSGKPIEMRRYVIPENPFPNRYTKHIKYYYYRLLGAFKIK